MERRGIILLSNGIKVLTTAGTPNAFVPRLALDQIQGCSSPWDGTRWRGVSRQSSALRIDSPNHVTCSAKNLLFVRGNEVPGVNHCRFPMRSAEDHTFPVNRSSPYIPATILLLDLPVFRDRGSANFQLRCLHYRCCVILVFYF